MSKLLELISEYFLGIPNESKKDYQNNTMGPITAVETFIPIGKTRILPIDMRDYAYRPGYVSLSDDEPKDYN